ncbi:hypothetical protein EUGRSUZ_L03509 [Eucalyptus grandis]|uniref:CYTH domain-containing protein n=1 Tax=Eucalyptus grandis TaxID=71139 RepID=A0AAD9T8R6_EUCGR|nr:hypothetical protein EUGRSUZ_L03509 [Eucalyptus grandis]
MEVEVKLRLPGADAHRRVASLLSPHRLRTDRQENLFFDGAAGELSSRRAVLRLRVLQRRRPLRRLAQGQGPSSSTRQPRRGDEEELDPARGRECVADPGKMGSMGSRVLRRCREEFGVGEFVGLGGFGNVRDVYEWKGLTLEVDETKYEFGTCYEIECESSDPEAVKKVIEEFLKENGVEYKYSEASKFAIFRSGKLPE